MVLDQQVNLRISSEDSVLIEKVMAYRHSQGVLRRQTLSEYIRYLLNRDISEVVAEIGKRRK